MTVITATPLTPGTANGELLLLDQPLSFWGGVDTATGEITDHTHPQHGASVTGKILAMRAARGSSSSSSALVECLRRGTAPAAIVLCETDPILVMGSLVGTELYGYPLPVIRIDNRHWPQLKLAQYAQITQSRSLATVTLA
jgi:predicted aconitase with swiveling domain